MKAHRFGVDRPVFTGVIFIAMTLFGLIALARLPVDLFPEIELPAISVITIYRGASAEDVEEKVTKLIEEGISTVPKVEDITSISKENLSAVTLAFEFGTDLTEATNTIRDRMDLFKRRLPEDIDTPTIFKFDLSMMPVIMLAVTSRAGNIQDETELVDERVVDALKRVPGVGSAMVFNLTPRQVVVELDRNELASRGLSLRQVAGAVAANNITLPAGNMQLGEYDYVIRLPGEYASLDEVREVIVGQSRTGGLVHLRDVAEVRFGYDEIRNKVRMNGEQALMLMVAKQSGANTVAVADAVLEAIPGIQAGLPPHLTLSVMMDTADFVRVMIGHLWQAVMAGGILVICVVFVFLRRLRSSLIIALTIPASMIIAFACLYAFGYTLNMISLMSMAMAVGMVVDNAIVVLESITRHREWGKGRREAAAIGTREVVSAILAATTTTIVVFAPLIFVSGMVGIMLGQLAFVIIVTLGASLLASLILTPMLCSKLLQAGRSEGDGRGPGAVLFRWSERGFARLEGAYRRVIAGALRHRALAIIVLLAAFGASLVLVRLVGVNLMPKQDSGDMMINFEMPVGTRVERTAEVADRITAIMKREIPEITLLFLRVGESRQGMGASFGGKQGTHVGMVGCKVVPLDQRSRSTPEMAEAIREEIRRIPGLASLDIRPENPMGALMTGGQKPVTVQVLGSDFAEMERAAARIGEILETVPGVVDVNVALTEKKPELHVAVDRLRAARLGLNMAMIADGVRTGFYGKPVTKYRAGGDEMDVFLRLKDEDKDDPGDLAAMPLTSMTGAQVQVGNFAEVKEGLGPIEINRLNKQRLITVGAHYKGRPLGEIITEVEEKIGAEDFPPGLGIQFGGDIKQQKETSEDLLLMLIMAIVMVYLVMSAQFESFLDPLVIMLSIPFAFTGVFLLLFLADEALSLPAALGLIMLMGVVVNNAIIFVDYAKLLRREGESLEDALMLAGQRRLRPILMTAFTTIGGMLPLALSHGEGHEMWRPMGIAVIGGLLFSTVTTLILIPVVYSSVEWLRRGEPARGGEETEPAGIEVSGSAA